MVAPQVLASTARSLSFLVTTPQARFSLPDPAVWRLEDAGGRSVASGQTETVGVFVDGLEPDQDYHLVTDHERLSTRTAPCAGLVKAQDFGAGPHSPDNAQALAEAIAAVPDGGTLWVDPGTYRTGPIFLKPRMTLHLAKGATLAAVADRTNWPQLAPLDDMGRVIGTWEGLPEASFAAVLTGIDCDGLRITGGGTIDGGGDKGDWWEWPKETRQGARRPRTIHLAHGKDISVTGITVQNSPSWTIHPYGCEGLRISNIRVQNPPDSPNTDGLNPESCAGVDIAAVDFSVGDDCIAIKAGKRRNTDNSHLAPTHEITIRNCRMQRGHGAVVLGSEMSGDIRNVAITDCEFLGTDRGLRLKTRRGRGGAIERVTLKNVVMDHVATPLAINAFYFCDADGKDDWVQSRAPADKGETTPHIRDVSLSGVIATNVSLAAAAITGLPEAPIEGIRIEDFRVSYDPEATAAPPLMACGIEPVRHAGILAEFAEVTGTCRPIESHEVPQRC